MKRILKKLRLLWFALRKFNDDNGLLLSSGLAFWMFFLVYKIIPNMRKYWENTIKNDLFEEEYCANAIFESQSMNPANGVTIQNKASLTSPRERTSMALRLP
jgi:hypothetical protein